MSRTQDFKDLAVSARALADLADVQKDTVDWWTQYGKATQDFMRDFTKCEPKKETHSKAAESAGMARQTEQENPDAAT